MTRTEHSRPKIGFIGLGHMGSHMVSRLLRAGHPVTVYDRTAERVQAMSQLGAASVNLGFALQLLGRKFCSSVFS